jgi:fibronectin type 3 domain-containing protein
MKKEILARIWKLLFLSVCLCWGAADFARATVNPIAVWNFDEAAGATAADSSGGGRTITLSGAYVRSAGKVNNAITFDGSTGYGVANWGQLTGPADRSISLWFKTTSGVDSTWVSWGSSAANSLSGIGIQGGSIGFLRNTTETSGISCVAPVASTNYLDGNWHHMAVVFRKNLCTIHVYIDGVLAMSRSRYPSTASSQIYFGRSVNGGTYFNGSIDEVAIYDRAITAQEVATISGVAAYPPKRVSVISPANAYGSDVTGSTTYTIAAPGFTSATVKCWQSGGTYGSDATVATVTLAGVSGTGSFTFPAASYPKGPMSLRITATNGTESDTCYLQLYNTAGVSWQEGMPAAPPQAAGYNLVFADDFTSMPEIVWGNSQVTASTKYIAYGDYSLIPFTAPTSPDTPFSQRDTYLRIRADAAKMTTGQISSVFRIKQPFYMECRFIAQNAMGSWPAFWSVTDDGNASTTAVDEQDIIEAYGGDGPGTPSSPRTYRLTSHEWNQTGIPPTQHISQGVEMATIGGQGGWAWTPHVYGMKVTATETIYYLDNVEVGRKATAPISQTDNFDVKMDMAAGGGWPIDFQRYAEKADMYIDYVRIYSGTGGGSAPAAPTGLIAAPGNAQVGLNWTASAGATSYNIYRGTTSGGQSSTPIATGITGTSYSNTGLTNGTTYYYKVAAVNASGTSSHSNEASATPTAGSVPAAPTGLTATAGNAQVSLGWTASSGATSYEVYRGTTANGQSTTPIATGITGTSYTNTGLTNGTAYYYKVKAVNVSGTSAYSNEASATPAASGGGSTAFANASFEAPATGNYVYNPSGATWTFTGNGGIQKNGSAFSGTAAVAPDGVQTAFLQSNGTAGAMSQSVNFASAGSYTISFKAARRYSTIQPVQVKVDGSVVGTYTPSSNSFETIATASFTVTAGNHTVSFTATDATADKTTFLDMMSISAVGSAPPAPASLAATAGNGQVGLSWAASSGATSYNVYRGTSAGGQSATPIATGITGTSYTNTGLSNGTTYFYKVAAVNASGTSAYSNEASATPTAGGGTAAFANASFETPSVGGYSYTPAGSGWTFTGFSGIQKNGSAYSGTSAVAPDGVQTAFLQGNGGTLGAMSQSVNFSAAGSYTVSFKAARRYGTIQPVRVKVDGITIGTYSPASGTFETLTTAPFTVTAGSHIISFEATDNTADKTTFIDLMSISSN